MVKPSVGIFFLFFPLFPALPCCVSVRVLSRIYYSSFLITQIVLTVVCFIANILYFALILHYHLIFFNIALLLRQSACRVYFTCSSLFFAYKFGHSFRCSVFVYLFFSFSHHFTLSLISLVTFSCLWIIVFYHLVLFLEQLHFCSKNFLICLISFYIISHFLYADSLFLFYLFSIQTIQFYTALVISCNSIGTWRSWQIYPASLPVLMYFKNVILVHNLYLRFQRVISNSSKNTKRAQLILPKKHLLTSSKPAIGEHTCLFFDSSRLPASSNGSYTILPSRWSI